MKRVKIDQTVSCKYGNKIVKGNVISYLHAVNYNPVHIYVFDLNKSIVVDIGDIIC